MKTKSLRIVGITASAFLFFAVSLSACAPTESNVSYTQSEQTLQRLQEAREIDLSKAKGSGGRAGRVWRLFAPRRRLNRSCTTLEHGQYVSQSRIDDALFVPPKSLSPEQRARLIDELTYARNLDNRGWWCRDPRSESSRRTSRSKRRKPPAPSKISKPASRSHGPRSPTASKYLDTPSTLESALAAPARRGEK